LTPKKKKKNKKHGQSCLKIARFSPNTKNPLKLLQRRNQACILHIDTYISARNNAISGQNSGNFNKIG
jgi:hypothetical protein